MKSFFELAIKNVANYGDTDIFPFPVENSLFFDMPDQVLDLLQAVEHDFEAALENGPPVNLNSLAPAGYAGFRWTTQLEPVWNAYLLALVLSYAERIEAVRIPVRDGYVFSYRYKPNTQTGALFDPTIGWPEFKKRSVELASQYEFVVVCDISDFYQRAYHHRVDNALRYIDGGEHKYKQIMELLSQLSNNVSYGLPIGGPASRILAELLLNNTDRLLRSHGLVFTRFVDDYHFYARSREDAHAALIRISEILYANEGLSLQKSKTRVMTSAEFSASSALIDADSEDPGRASLLKLALRFDPYSANAKQEYAELESAVNKIDVLGILAQELTKTRIHSPLIKKLVSAIQFLPPKQRNDAVMSLIQNLELLSPLFGTVVVTIKGLFDSLDLTTQDAVLAAMRLLIHNRSHIVQVDLHLGYAIRILGSRHSDEAEGLLTRTYENTQSPFVRKEIIFSMARWSAFHWLSDKKRFFQVMTSWEKRAFLIGSYILGDAGKHFRDHVKHTFDPFTALLHKWCGTRADQIRNGQIPI